MTAVATARTGTALLQWAGPGSACFSMCDVLSSSSTLPHLLFVGTSHAHFFKAWQTSLAQLQLELSLRVPSTMPLFLSIFMDFIRKVISFVPDLNSHLILGGDLNGTTDPPLDNYCHKRNLPSRMTQIGCVDPWRFFHPETKRFSFYSQVHKTSSRIDNFFL